MRSHDSNEARIRGVEDVVEVVKDKVQNKEMEKEKGQGKGRREKLRCDSVLPERKEWG